MIKAKELSLENVVLLAVLVASVAASVYLARPQVRVTANTPVFIGEEMTVQRGVTAVKTVTRAVEAPKTVAQPAPVQTSLPLPIVPPSVTNKVLPIYPETALSNGVEGLVRLSVLVGLSGAAEQIAVQVSSGAAELDAAAVQAVKQWRFSPAAQGGAALASWFELPVRFALN
ncbi:MAG: energy transducer TonB [Candidatus Margulisiibacteriota bacterium]